MIAEATLAELLARTVFGLAVVLSIVAVGYFVAKRRAVPMPATGGSRRRTQSAPVEVVGRVGLGRNAAAVAVRFGDRVLLVATSEQGHSTLAEMPADEWDEIRTVRQPVGEADRRAAVIGTAPAATSPTTARPNFLEALRQATARHA